MKWPSHLQITRFLQFLVVLWRQGIGKSGMSGIMETLNDPHTVDTAIRHQTVCIEIEQHLQAPKSWEIDENAYFWQLYWMGSGNVTCIEKPRIRAFERYQNHPYRPGTECNQAHRNQPVSYLNECDIILCLTIMTSLIDLITMTS